MRRAAEALVARGHKATFVYHLLHRADAQNRTVLAQLRELEAAGVCEPSEIVGAVGAGASGVAAGGRRRSLREWVQAHPAIRLSLRALRVHVAVRALALAFVPQQYVARRRRYRAWLRRTKPDIIVLPEDVVGYVTPLVILAGHDLGIPSLILPYTMANQLEAFQSLKSNPAYSLDSPSNRLAGLLFPSWVMRRDGAAVLRLPAPYVIGHAVTGTAPPDPWMMNSGFANRIAVENQVMLDYYTQAGIPASKLEVVGALSDDDLARQRAEKPQALARLKAELGISGDLPLLLIGGCPNQLGVAPGFDFAGYDEMVAHMLGCLEPLRQHYIILMRPHPNFVELRSTFEARGIRCSMLETARLVALSDVYIAFASATLRWAVACGIPSINYDAFHYDYGDYKAAPGVLNVSRPEEFRQAVAQLAPSSDAYRALLAASKGEQGRWGRLDGRSAERIEGLIERLCAERPAPRTAA
ncbi:MAG: hypothetical protein AB7O37_20840 [Vicinamibacteria bacterium]